jgi:hypothetical protein
MRLVSIQDGKGSAMTRKSSSLLALLCVGVLLVSCSKELKPDRKGVFIASGGKLMELKTVSIDSEFTPEGFAITYFSTEPPKVKLGDFYFILYGDYQVSDLKGYVQKGNRWEIDTSKTGLNTTIETIGMKGEPNMQKCRFTKPLDLGTYALEAQQNGATLYFAFTVSSGY